MEKHFIRQETMSRYSDKLIQAHFQSQKKLLGLRIPTCFFTQKDLDKNIYNTQPLPLVAASRIPAFVAGWKLRKW
jgi:hypothetical protein